MCAVCNRTFGLCPVSWPLVIWPHANPVNHENQHAPGMRREQRRSQFDIPGVHELPPIFTVIGAAKNGGRFGRLMLAASKTIYRGLGDHREFVNLRGHEERKWDFAPFLFPLLARITIRPWIGLDPSACSSMSMRFGLCTPVTQRHHVPRVARPGPQIRFIRAVGQGKGLVQAFMVFANFAMIASGDHR
jgi:hypothetical protein